MKPITIVGAGLAGYTVAREFRKLDKKTPLAIVTADHGSYYSKPALSNAFAKGKRAEQLVMQTSAQMAAELDAVMTTGARLQYIDSVQKVIGTDVGLFSYEKLVIAVGAKPRRVVVGGDAADQLLSINHLDDYADFRMRLETAAQGRPAHIILLGAGLIGCEFANDLADAGHLVTLIDPNSMPLASLAPPMLSAELQLALAAKGVAFKLGTTATAIDRTASGLRVAIADGDFLEADLVLSAVGLQVDLALARAANLATGRGILVDASGRTSAQDIYALGDCAEYTINADGDTCLLPYIAPLMAAARAIARTLAGQATLIDLSPAPVIVKTPCYPLALLPPPAHRTVNGCWISQKDGVHTTCRFYDAHGVMAGFGIASHEFGLRQELLTALRSAKIVASPVKGASRDALSTP